MKFIPSDTDEGYAAIINEDDHPVYWVTDKFTKDAYIIVNPDLVNEMLISSDPPRTMDDLLNHLFGPSLHYPDQAYLITVGRQV